MTRDEEVEEILTEHFALADVLGFVVARDDVRRIGVPLIERLDPEDAPIPTLLSRVA